MSINDKFVHYVFIVVAVVLIVGALVTTYFSLTSIKYDPSPKEYASPPLQLNSSSEKMCRVGFSFPQHIENDRDFPSPIIESEINGERFNNLPNPLLTGYVFAGWFLDSDFTLEKRVNGSKIVNCDDDERITLFGKWIKNSEFKKERSKNQIPVLVFHQFDNHCSEDNLANCLPSNEFEKMMEYIANEKFYLPTWQEISAFIDGKLDLPDRSVVITDDDCQEDWHEIGEKIIEKYDLFATSFVITNGLSSEDIFKSKNVDYRSHSNNLHYYSSQNSKKAQIHYANFGEQINDFETSRDILRASEVFAFPYGQYNRLFSNTALKHADFKMAVTLLDGSVKVGTNKMRIPRIYVLNDWTVETLVSAINKR